MRGTPKEVPQKHFHHNAPQTQESGIILYGKEAGHKLDPSITFCCKDLLILDQQIMYELALL